jgi:hypothetical protein
MSQSLVVQEFGIIVAIKDNKPAILNPDFLKYTGIVPSEWELARQPVFSSSVSQVTYTNGVSIIAEPNRVIFIEAIEGKKVEEIAVYEIAKKYVQMLPNAEYQGLGINPRGYVSFPGDQQDAARQFMSETMFMPGAWQEVGNVPVRATMNLVYSLEPAALYLTINEAALRNSDETTTPILLFSGSFSYEATGENASEKLASLLQSMENWQANLENYSDIINNKFLGKTSSTISSVPDVFSMNSIPAAV